MNTDIHWEKVGIVLVAVAGIAGIFFMLGKKSNEGQVMQVPIMENQTILQDKKDSSTLAQDQKSAPVFNPEELKAAVYLAAYHDSSTKEERIPGGGWSRKVDIIAVEKSQRAAYGKWWAKDAWDWIAYQSEDGRWNVSVSRDTNFDCSVMKNVVAQYDGFFNTAADLDTYRLSKNQCGIK